MTKEEENTERVINQILCGPEDSSRTNIIFGISDERSKEIGESVRKAMKVRLKFFVACSENRGDKILKVLLRDAKCQNEREVAWVILSAYDNLIQKIKVLHEILN